MDWARPGQPGLADRRTDAERCERSTGSHIDPGHLVACLVYVHSIIEEHICQIADRQQGSRVSHGATREPTLPRGAALDLATSRPSEPCE